MTDLVLSQLALPGLELQPNAAVIDSSTSTADLKIALRTMDLVGSSAHWWQGDIALEAIRRVRDGDPDLGDDDAPVDQPTAARTLRVAEKFPVARRRAALSWSHHEAVCPFDAGTQDAYLDAAEERSLSVHALRDLIKADQHQAKEQAALPGMAKLPSPPSAPLRAILDVDPDAWVVWHPKTGTVRKAER